MTGLGTSGDPRRTWDRRFVRLLLRPFVKSPLTPNHLTGMRLVAGVTAGILYGFGDAGALWASGFYLLAVILDHADGELARMSGQSSAFGHKFDRLTDGVNHFALFTGLGVGLCEAILGRWAVPMGLGAGLAGAFTVYLRVLNERRLGRMALSQPGWGGFEIEDVMYLVGPVTWLGELVFFLTAASVGTPLFLIWQAWDIRRARRGGRMP